MNATAEWVIRRPVWAALIVVVALALLLTQCRGGGSAASTVATSATPTITSATTVAESTPEATTAAPEDESPADNSVASRVALRFVQAWLADPGGKTWLAGIKRYATPTLYTAYAKYRPGPTEIPDAHTSGDPVGLLDGPALYRYRVALDNDAAVQVDVITDGGAPLVSQIVPETH